MIAGLSEKYIDECIKIYLDVFQHDPFGYNWLTEGATRRYFIDSMKCPGYRGYVYLREGRLLGACLGQVNDYFLASQYEIKEIFIERKTQGSGKGSDFLREIEMDLAGNGINYITLLTQRNIKAYEFYMKNEYAESTDTVYLMKSLGRID